MSVRFVAEVSSNHNQDLSRCLRFVETASALGCQAVKFQLFEVGQLFAPEALMSSEDQIGLKLSERKGWELPVEFLRPISALCSVLDIGFACTPFHLQAVGDLLPYVDFFKVASYELLWDELLAACGRTGKPIVLSTGMATLDEIDHATVVLHASGCQDLTLLHCVSSYPTPPAECNLAAIATLRERFGHPAGWSDHSKSPSVLYRAVHHWGAAMVEFHLDLDGSGAEVDFGHCWLPEEIGLVIESITSGFQSDGDGQKSPMPSELFDRDWRADPSDGLRPLLRTRDKLT